MKAVNVSSNYIRSSGQTWGSSRVRVKRQSHLGVLQGVISYTSLFPTINICYLYSWEKEWKGREVSGRAEVRVSGLEGQGAWHRTPWGRASSMQNQAWPHMSAFPSTREKRQWIKELTGQPG